MQNINVGLSLSLHTETNPKWTTDLNTTIRPLGKANTEEKWDGLRFGEESLHTRPKARSLENNGDESGFTDIKESCYVSDSAETVNAQTASWEKTFPNHVSV